MTEGTLFNSGFLGASFNWWIGQIADDSYWRDNIVSGKFDDKNNVPGWGRRYKVRIIGLHDQEEESIDSDQLPWAQVMYPITAGGGQANAGATSALRQGNFVFGFFLDGADQQVPVIMGVLGNNAQTALNTKPDNYKPFSGYSKGKDPDPNIKVPADGLTTKKPGSKPANPKSGVTLDKFGRDPSRPPTSRELAAAQSARAEAAARGLSPAATEALVGERTVAATKAEAAESQSPTSPTQPGATIEQPDNPHLMSVADIQRNELYLNKIVILNPCDLVGSSMKAIQTEIENLTRQIDKILQTAQSYVDAASNILGEIKKLIADFACIIAKYMKMIFDKILEYILKKINSALTAATDAIPPNLRFKFFDVREKITELINCLFSKITNGLCGQIQGFLDGSGDSGTGTGETATAGTGETAKKSLLDINTIIENGFVPAPPMCSVEILTGHLIASNLPDIAAGMENSLSVVDNFLEDTRSFLLGMDGIVSDDSNISSSFSGFDVFDGVADSIFSASNVLDGISETISGISNTIGGISGSLSSAMSFANLSVNIFGCDLSFNCPAGDYYTLQEGSGDSEESQQPRTSVASSAAQDSVPPPSTTELPYVSPTPGTPDVDSRIGTSTPQTREVAAQERQLLRDQARGTLQF